MQPSTDVVGIGNALVDVLSRQTDDFVAAQGLTKGSMTLIDAHRADDLYAATGPGVEISGGCAANTMVGVASFGGGAVYVGRVRDDQLGHVFVHDLRSTGVGFDVAPAAVGSSTGRCLILITPDAQRTMNTYLGASNELEMDDVDLDVVRSARALYLEGYLWDPPVAREAMRAAAAAAHDAGRLVSLSLSDSFAVERHRDSFRDLIDDHVGLLFGNEDEVCALYEVGTVEAAVAEVRSHVGVAAITRGRRGSLVVAGDQIHEVAAVEVERRVDTTGAGDLYAAGFLYGITHGHDLPTCGHLGSIAAAEVITHVGARPERPLHELAADALAPH